MSIEVRRPTTLASTKYHFLEDRVYDIELIELVKKVPKPKEVKVGAKRVYYDFKVWDTEEI